MDGCKNDEEKVSNDCFDALFAFYGLFDDPHEHVVLVVVFRKMMAASNL